MFFKNYFRKKKLLKVYNQNQIERKFVGLKEIKRVGIVFLSEQGVDSEVTELGKYFQKNKIQCKFLGYSPSKNLPMSFIGNSSSDILTKKDLTWLGILKQERENIFLGESFDLLINMAPQPNEFIIDYLVAQTPAKLKITASGGNNTFLYDLFTLLEGDKISPKNYIKGITTYLENTNNPLKFIA